MRRDTVLLQTSRQLRIDTHKCLALPRKRVHHLDVLFVNDGGLWPTWLSQPGPARHVDMLHAQFRVEELSKDKDVASTWKKIQWGNGRGSGKKAALTFGRLITSYLQSGPTLPPFSTYDSRAENTIGRLVLDVPLAPEAEDGSSPVIPRFAGERYLFGAPGRFVARREDGQLEWVRSREEADPRRLPAEKLAYFMRLELIRILKCRHFTHEILYDGIGVMEIRVDGELRWLVDTEAQIQHARQTDPDDEAWCPRHPKSSFMCQMEKVHSRRKERGLDVVARVGDICYDVYKDMKWRDYGD
ncbi:hypothetical protein ACHAQA_005873 [Verticillium albo-atrum]